MDELHDVDERRRKRSDATRSLLFCAHPGHELRIYGWMKASRPTVCFLTDGSGFAGKSRLVHSNTVLASVGAAAGPLYGVSTDRSIYAALLRGDLDLFRDLAHALCRTLIAGEYTEIVGDAIEWYNPSHDVARMIIDAAVRMAKQDGALIRNYAFPLVGDPRQTPPGTSTMPVSAALTLDAATLGEKIETARAYARQSGDALVSEVRDAIERFGIDAFRCEPLFRANENARDRGAWSNGKPFYETHGERQVAGGQYSDVIRWSEHVRPVDIALRQLAASSARADATVI